MLKLLNRNLRLLYSHLRWPTRRRSRPKLKIKRFGPSKPTPDASSAAVHPSAAAAKKHVRIATFNAALFSMAPAISFGPNSTSSVPPRTLRRPKSILKRSSGPAARPEMRVSINLPEDEIGRFLRPPPRAESAAARGGGEGSRTVAEVLREVDADIVALQDVKAEEEKDMRPLSDLAAALGMSFVFAESWAPEYGNAVLSKWPIKSSTVHKIFDHTDFRNVLNVTIEVPKMGEVNFKCTHLDHLDENWRMKQVNAIIQSDDEPHILVGGLNSLEESDYSQERWTDIVKYYEDMGKPTPKVEVMRHFKSKHYTDAKDFAGECESVVMIAKGQSVQGTCKYGTRVDYILASPNLVYEFVPGSYSVYSSKGTSDHHIVKVDIAKVDDVSQENAARKRKQTKPKVMKMSGSLPVSKGIWKIRT